ncbi:MAG TPA: hypothetical protein VMW42_01735 [Desulfatiglandales bacterium]|nr:hypothetical protein [Desulfatiglandales bacterium]
MPISSRRYLFTYGHVVKYLGFADKVADPHKLRGINSKYLTTANPGGVYPGDIVFQKQS